VVADNLDETENRIAEYVEENSDFLLAPALFST
jgi:hypothetical protein